MNFIFRILVVLGAPKLTVPTADVLDGAPNVKLVLAAGVPKLRPLNSGALVAGVGNKLVVVVVVVVLDPKAKPLGCVCGAVAGVLLNPKLRPAVVVCVAGPPKGSASAGAVEPKGVLVKLKPVAGLRNYNELSMIQHILTEENLLFCREILFRRFEFYVKVRIKRRITHTSGRIRNSYCS